MLLLYLVYLGERTAALFVGFRAAVNKAAPGAGRPRPARLARRGRSR
jgi:hypothetical protein